jgi:hypothetical protein
METSKLLQKKVISNETLHIIFEAFILNDTELKFESLKNYRPQDTMLL